MLQAPCSVSTCCLKNNIRCTSCAWLPCSHLRFCFVIPSLLLTSFLTTISTAQAFSLKFNLRSRLTFTAICLRNFFFATALSHWSHLSFAAVLVRNLFFITFLLGLVFSVEIYLQYFFSLSLIELSNGTKHSAVVGQYMAWERVERRAFLYISMGGSDSKAPDVPHAKVLNRLQWNLAWRYNSPEAAIQRWKLNLFSNAFFLRVLISHSGFVQDHATTLWIAVALLYTPISSTQIISLQYGCTFDDIRRIRNYKFRSPTDKRWRVAQT